MPPVFSLTRWTGRLCHVCPGDYVYHRQLGIVVSARTLWHLADPSHWRNERKFKDFRRTPTRPIIPVTKDPDA